MTQETGSTAAVLAVDGGNSKTDLALVAADGTLLAAVRGPGCSHQRLGLTGAMEALRAGVTALRAATFSDPSVKLAEVGVFCLAGMDLPVDERRIGAALRAEALTETLVLHNDTRAVLWAGSPSRWGVAVGAGTGLNCVGIAPDGQEIRFPALGLISGDWVAGGRWLGVRALGQAVRARDGRGPRTVLERAVPTYFGLPDPMAVAEAIYTGRIAERQLLTLAPTVFGAAAGRDPVARSLVNELAQEVVTYVTATVRRLNLAALEVPVVLGGGLFRTDDPEFVAQIREGVLAAVPRAQLRVLSTPPVLGAGLLGLARLRAGLAAGTRLAASLSQSSLAESAALEVAPAVPLDGATPEGRSPASTLRAEQRRLPASEPAP